MADKTQNINDWLKEHEETIKKDQQDNSKFARLDVGENLLEILKIPATKHLTDENGVPLKFGERWYYTVKQNQKEKILSASKILDRMLFECMKEGIFEIHLIKTGEGKNTRYDIKELSQKR